MSAILQARVRETEAISEADPELPIAGPVPGRDDPLQLLREAITRLNSPGGELPDQSRMADLLAEVQEALERANIISRAATQCEEFLRDAQFDKAFQSLDAGLLAYPGDPALIARRNDAEERQRAFQSAVTVRTALDEAQWLLSQDRLDLAAGFLKEKAVGLPDQPALISRLAEIEALLPQWEQDRHVQAALGRVAALEELQQWQVALTAVEEALQSYSASDELTGAAKRVRDRLADNERRKKLARRLELIGQKVAAGSWRQALTLLEETEREFAGAPELKPLRRDVDAGLRRSECEAIVREVRQCLADDELEPAEQVLRKGLEAFGPEPVLEALREELESERKYREELRTAQILFGRRQLPEAERVLVALVAQDRPEAQVLLDAVKRARAVTEEENFCERGREKALRLMQQQQFAPAVDLLRNLRSLFPGNPILERDLIAAQAACDQLSPGVVVIAGEEATGEEATGEKAAGEEHRSDPQAPRTPAWPPPGGLYSGTTGVNPPSRVRRAAIAGTASLVLVSAAGVAWKFSHHGPSQNSKPVSAQSATLAAPRLPVATQLPIATQPLAVAPLPIAPLPIAPPPIAPLPIVKQAAPGPSAVRPVAITQKPSVQQPAPKPAAPKSAAPKPAAPEPPAPEPLARSLRPFLPPATKQTPAQVQGSEPLPPEPEVVVSAQAVTGLPEGLVRPVLAPPPRPVAPAPASAPPPRSAAPAPASAPPPRSAAPARAAAPPPRSAAPARAAAPPPRSAAPAPATAPPPASPAASGYQAAQLINRTAPVYPAMARERHIVGVVQIEATVDEHGIVKNTKILSGDSILATAARDAVLRWQYKAATENGRPVASTATIQVSFQ